MFIKYIFSILNTADEIFEGSKMSIHFRPTCKQISGEFRQPKVVNQVYTGILDGLLYNNN